MSLYIIQVYNNGITDYKKVEASSYEEARDKVSNTLIQGRIIAITKQRES